MNTRTPDNVTAEAHQASAERRAEEIAVHLRAIVENYQAVLMLIRDAVVQGDQRALGYRTVEGYVFDCLGHSMADLSVKARGVFVSDFVDAGLSARAASRIDRRSASGTGPASTRPCRRSAQPERRLLSRGAAAAYLGIGLRSLDKLAANGAFAKSKVAGRVLYDLCDLDAYIERVKAGRA